jgi:hypothetical protein
VQVSLLMAANAIRRDTCMFNGRSVLIRLVISVKLELDAAVRSLRHFSIKSSKFCQVLDLCHSTSFILSYYIFDLFL